MMGKLNIEEIKRYGYKIFNNKAEMLKYIEKASFKDDTLCIRRIKKKWIVWWE